MNGPEPDRELAHRALGAASEAIQALRSHEALNTLKFENMTHQMSDVRRFLDKQDKETKQLFHEQSKDIDRRFNDAQKDGNLRYENLHRKMDDGFKSFENRFWTLAITVITLLVSALIAMVVKLLFPHVGG